MSDHQRPGDEPWADVSADSDLMGGVEQPAPAEVVGGEDDDLARDLAGKRVPDPMEKYIPETLDQRLAEEEPEGVGGASDAEAGELVDPGGGGDVQRSEPEAWDGTAPPEEPGAEDAAIHVVDEDRIV